MLWYPVVGLLALLPAALIAGGLTAPFFDAPMWTLLVVLVGFAVAPPLAGLPGRWTNRRVLAVLAYLDG
jgi:hypothetical protein